MSRGRSSAGSPIPSTTRPKPPKPCANMPDMPPLWTSDEIAAATGGALSGPAFEAGGLTYNSREIVPGDLFLALKGARDGHDFAASAYAAGATGALTEHRVDGGPSVIVPDTLRAL